MTGERRQVRMGPSFEAIARQEFPPGGSAEGRPSYELFVDGPLKAFEAAFQHWERNAMPLPGVDTVRSADVANNPYFPLLTAIAVLVRDNDEYVELVDLLVDWDFWTRDEPP
jgi:hypothetical protein